MDLPEYLKFDWIRKMKCVAIFCGHDLISDFCDGNAFFVVLSFWLNFRCQYHIPLQSYNNLGIKEIPP